jgi:hypothetical protein
MPKTWKKKHVLVSKPHDIELPLQWIQSIMDDIMCHLHQCHVEIVINGYPKDQWDECRHKKRGLWLKDGVVPN